MLTQAQANRVAAMLNHVVDIPFLTEEMEQPLFENAVGLIVGNLASVLPEQLRTIIGKYLNTSEEGLEEENVPEFSDNLLRTLNKKLDIPLLGEEQEASILGYFSDILGKGMMKGETFDKVLDVAELHTWKNDQ